MEGEDDGGPVPVFVDLVSDEEPPQEGRRTSHRPPPPPPPPTVTRVTGVKAASPQKKKAKVSKVPTEEEEEEEDDGRVATLADAVEAIGALQRENAAMKREVGTLHREMREMKEMRNVLEHILCVSLRIRKDEKTHKTELKFKPGQHPRRTLAEVQFRGEDEDDAEGEEATKARYPGMDRKPFNPPPEGAPWKKTKKKKMLSPDEAVVVVMEQHHSADELLSVPYYTAMEQVKVNTERLHYLNERIVPVLEKNQLLIRALAERTGALIAVPASMRTDSSPDGVYLPAQAWPDPRVPHVNVDVISAMARRETQAEREKDQKEEERAIRFLGTTQRRIQGEVLKAEQESRRLAAQITFSGAPAASADGGEERYGALMAMQSQLNALKNEIEELKKAPPPPPFPNDYDFLGGGDDVFGPI